MKTIHKPKNELEVIKLPLRGMIVECVSIGSIPALGKDANRDKLVLHFAEIIGGRPINSRGLSVMWERSIIECFPQSLQEVRQQMEEYFPSIARAIVPGNIAFEAIEFRDEFLREEAVIAMRRF